MRIPNVQTCELNPDLLVGQRLGFWTPIEAQREPQLSPAVPYQQQPLGKKMSEFLVGVVSSISAGLFSGTSPPNTKGTSTLFHRVPFSFFFGGSKSTKKGAFIPMQTRSAASPGRDSPVEVAPASPPRQKRRKTMDHGSFIGSQAFLRCYGTSKAGAVSGMMSGGLAVS